MNGTITPEMVMQLASDFKLMCQYYLSTMEGDTHKVEDAYKLMKEYGFVDEDGFPTDSLYE